MDFEEEQAYFLAKTQWQSMLESGQIEEAEAFRLSTLIPMEDKQKADWEATVQRMSANFSR